MEMTAFWFGVYKLVKYLVYPYTWLVLLLAFQLLLLGRGAARRLGAIRAIAILAFGIVFIMGHPLVDVLLVGPLEARYPPFDASSGKGFEAIVVLSGGVATAGTLRPEDDLAEETRARTICGARRYAEGVAPRLLLSGGDASVFGSGPNEAQLMKVFAMQLGVPEHAIVLENRSRTTYENAVETKRKVGSGAALLVTSASHMPRAMALFQKQNVNVTAAPCNYVLRNYPVMWSRLSPFDFIPTAGSLDIVTQGLNEWVGLLVYRMAGRI